jgi:hypothetical protein
MARRKAAEWSDLVMRWKRSGKTAEQFGAAAGVAARSLHWWNWALRKREALQSDLMPSSAPVAAFLPVRVVERADATEVMTSLPCGAVEIVVDERHAVRVGPGFDEATLRRVLGVLRSAEVA